jgi:Protein of unknown function (DUF2846)
MKKLLVLLLIFTGGCAMSTLAQQIDKHELESRACGPKNKEVHYAESAGKKEHPTPELPAGKALIYVIRPTVVGMLIQTKLAVDGDWKGVNKGDTYFFFTLDPGEHAFCSVAENHAVMEATIEAGKTYYLQQHIEMGVMKARNEISFVSADEGARKLEKLHLATWREK